MATNERGATSPVGLSPTAVPTHGGWLLPTELWGALVAFALHGALAVTLVSVRPPSWIPRTTTVEMEVVERRPPPPPPAPEPEPPPPPEPRPRPTVRRLAIKPPPVEQPPPPPNQPPPAEPPPDPAPPVFGVTLDSTVTGNAGMAVPVGNTLMTPDRATGRPGPQAPTLTQGPPEFAPAPESSIGAFPELVREVKADFPSEARRMGMEGAVVMRVAIDRQGVIRSVRLVKKAGYGFDDAAVKAMWKTKFQPARTRDGQAVDFLITYTYRFQSER